MELKLTIKQLTARYNSVPGKTAIVDGLVRARVRGNKEIGFTVCFEEFDTIKSREEDCGMWIWLTDTKGEVRRFKSIDAAVLLAASFGLHIICEVQ